MKEIKHPLPVGSRVRMREIVSDGIIVPAENATIRSYDAQSDTYVMEGDEEGICEVPTDQIEIYYGFKVNR